jgi:hypothetical protein
MPTQLSSPITWSDTDAGNRVVNASRLTSHVTGASLLKGAVTEQGAVTAPATGDYVLGTDTSNSDALAKFTVGAMRRVPSEYDATGTWTGSPEIYTIDLDPLPSTYEAGMRILFKATAANAGPCNVNLSKLGGGTIGSVDLLKAYNVELAANDILAGQVVEAVFDGTAFQW